ncbi:MAG: penicillin acylase family protein, partial [Pseudobdellovibrionaceae bacterium]
MNIVKRFAVCFLALIWILTSLGCATLFSRPNQITEKGRLSLFPSNTSWPIHKPVKIYWSTNMIPFVEAETDEDCAFAIGVVHAYLRLGQMEIFKRGSAGRLSESAGPIATPKIDETLRRLDLGRANEGSYQMLSSDDKIWLEQYIAGINFFIKQTNELPYEFNFLDIEKEKWTYADSLRIGRLAGGDANWSSLLSFLDLRKSDGWESAWEKKIENSKESLPTATTTASLDLEKFLSIFTKTGSNSVVVAGNKSKNEGGLIASDPHLGIFVPNLWLLMGYKSPSYHTVGYMLPGVPAVTLGRNKDIAWGGTYMRGTSSHLFEVRPDQITRIRKEVIKRRFWFDKTVEIKESVLGPVVFEGKDPKTKRQQMIALNWVGHQPSNELGSFLNANRSKNWDSFKAGFKDFAVSGLNITYADKSGNIGFLPAIRQPILKDNSEYDSLVKSDTNSIESYRGPLALPSAFNSRSGFFVSANNMPFVTSPPLARAFAQNDRFKRWSQLLSTNEKISATELKSWQLDTFSEDSLALSRQIISELTGAPKELTEYFNKLKNWDGFFGIESEGAVAFETL